MTKKIFQELLILALCTGLLGCGTASWQGYAGAPLPDNETAYVRVEETGTDRLAPSTQIVSIDAPRGDIVPLNTRAVRLRPGDVCVGVLATTSTMDQASAELCFVAEADTVYEIRVQVAGVERDLVDTQNITRRVERGPFRVTQLFMVNAATAEIVAVRTALRPNPNELR